MKKKKKKKKSSDREISSVYIVMLEQRPISLPESGRKDIHWCITDFPKAGRCLSVLGWFLSILVWFFVCL